MRGTYFIFPKNTNKPSPSLFFETASTIPTPNCERNRSMMKNTMRYKDTAPKVARPLRATCRNRRTWKCLPAQNAINSARKAGKIIIVKIERVTSTPIKNILSEKTTQKPPPYGGGFAGHVVAMTGNPCLRSSPRRGREGGLLSAVLNDTARRQTWQTVTVRPVVVRSHRCGGRVRRPDKVVI